MDTNFAPCIAVAIHLEEYSFLHWKCFISPLFKILLSKAFLYSPDSQHNLSKKMIEWILYNNAHAPQKYHTLFFQITVATDANQSLAYEEVYRGKFQVQLILSARSQ